MKKAICILLCLSLLPLLCSCDNAISRDEAEYRIEKLMTALEGENYQGVLSLMHPDYKCDEEQIVELVDQVEKAEGVEFSDGITVARYTNFRSALYDSNVGGGYYSLSGYITVSEKQVYFKVELARTGEDFGICNFSFGN